MAIGVVHVAIGEDADVAGAIDAARLDQHVLGLAAIGAAVHAQRAADRAGNAAQEREPGEAGLLRRPRDPDVRHRGAGADALALDLDVAETAAERMTTPGTPPSRTIRLEPSADDGHRNVGRQMRKEIREVVLVVRHEQHLRRPADAEPGELGASGWFGKQPPAQRGSFGFQIGDDDRERPSPACSRHLASAASSPGSA